MGILLLIWIPLDHTTHPKSGQYLLVAAHIKKYGKNNLLFLASFLSLSLANESTFFLGHNGIWTSFGIPRFSEDQLEGQQLSRNPLEL